VLAEIGLSAVDGLVHALETDNKPVRSHILQTLSRIAPDRADAIAALTAVANDAAMPGIDRFYAVHALEKIGPHATKDIDPAAIYREISPDR
jgi:HEAT repeat protein